ncbi:hypothetical protein GE300_01545 [Rhodobacteraceae bacterium 2CG4]|uniref:Dihydroorotate dehydrogenase n=1 Tax=Halovulum marinum TaxID=2662447 RepID=A0A6L5YWI5_9RHOB|nr:hypothetical protein [Halovulum marinum]MSU88299.1 hypothetical protein [Halovulum marinum]
MTYRPDRTPPEGPDLDAAFAELRAAEPPPRPAFMETLMADALAAMPAAAVPRRRGAGRMLLAAIGGWVGGAALAGAAVGGMAVGYLDPVGLSPVLSDGDLAYEAADAPADALLAFAEEAGL